MDNITVKKLNGETEEYSEKKLRESLVRCCADEEMAQKVVEEIREKIYDGMETKVIYNEAKRMLKDMHKPSAGKYSLREALSRMGPDGYPFEKFISRLLEAEGYDIHLNEIKQGKCVTHEIDVCATNRNEKELVECKFHGSEGIICGIQTVLYMKARFKDLDREYDKVLLATNTKFSKQSVKFARCHPYMRLLGWRYPKGKGLEKLIEQYHIWPVTLVDEMKPKEVQKALAENLILLSELKEMDKGKLKHLLQIDDDRADKLKNEAEELLEGME